MINVIRFQKSRFLPPNGISKNFWHLTSKYVQSSCNTNVKCKNNYFRRKKVFVQFTKKLFWNGFTIQSIKVKLLLNFVFSTIKTNFSIVFISDYALMTCLFLWATLRHYPRVLRLWFDTPKQWDLTPTLWKMRKFKVSSFPIVQT